MRFLRLLRPGRGSEVASPELVRQIGLMSTYGNADGEEVIRRLRNMNYGATNSRITKLRESRSEPDQTPSPRARYST